MPELPEKLAFQAPAKLNLHLSVGKKRPDGFHDIESVFLAVDFADTLYFELNSANTAEIDMEWKNCLLPPEFVLPMEKNIIFRALSLFRERTGFEGGLKITVEKRIPVGGGLGGGSSDAAATLLALNKLSGGRLSRDALMEMGSQLGSDVPFFLCRVPAAKVSGRGEISRPIELPPCFVVLVNPGFPSDTAAAYRLLDKKVKKVTGTVAGTVADTVYPFYNDFLPIFEEPEKSTYQKIISQLNDLGAEFAGLSGSGSSCFGLFKERAQAEKAAAALSSSWKLVVCCSSM